MKKGENVLEVNLTPDTNNAGFNILELKIKAPSAPETTPTPDEKITTLIYMDETIEEENLPIITHAITDTLDRVIWQEQIQLVTSKHSLPKHLEKVESQDEDIFEVARAKAPCNLIVITNEKSKDLTRAIAKASEFFKNAYAIQPTNTIELIDSLNDHIKHLKPKTLVNVKVKIELNDENDVLKPLNYIPELTKSGNTYFSTLIDLASEDEKAYAFHVSSASVTVKFDYEDLLLMRVVQGGMTAHLM